MKTTLAIAGITILTLVLTVVGLGMSAHNSEVNLRNQITKQQTNLENHFDKTWKSIKQVAQVAEAGKEGFREIYPELMAGRYDNQRGGALMSWVSENNPNPDFIKLYDRLAVVIESQREGFTREQEKLLDMKREHDNVLQQLPSSLFVGGRDSIEVEIVTSAVTDEVFESGQDNDIDVFN